MKKNRLVALTALLTLLGAPLSKAQETKGGSQQSTPAQSEKTANKDSKKKDSEKDGKKLDAVASNEALLSRRINFGYSLEWIKKNWSWLTAMSGTGIGFGVVGNKMGKEANVEAKVQQIVNAGYMKKTEVENNYTKNEHVNAKVQQIVNAGYMKKTEVDAKINEKVQEEVEEKVQNGELFTVEQVDNNYTRNEDVEKKAKELAGNKKYTDEELDNILKDYTRNADVDEQVQQKIDAQIESGDLVEKNKVDKRVQEEIEAKIQSNGLFTSDQVNVKVDEKINQKVSSGDLFKKDVVENNYTENAVVANQYIKKDNNDAIKQAAAGLGIKYTEEELNQKINAAVLSAQSKGLLTRVVDKNKKKLFDDYVGKLDKKLSDSLKLIQTGLSGDFVDILAKTQHGTFNKDDQKTAITNDKVVSAISMLADLKNALINEQASNLNATIDNSTGTNDGAWSKFKFQLGSKSYSIFFNHQSKSKFYVSDDGNKTEYLIPLK